MKIGEVEGVAQGGESAVGKVGNLDRGRYNRKRGKRQNVDTGLGCQKWLMQMKWHVSRVNSG